MKPVKIRNVVIGEGIPKIIVPIVGVTREEILAEAKSFGNIPADVTEWRADWFEDAPDKGKVCGCAGNLRETLGEIPILFTFRTSREGGEKTVSLEDYMELNLSVARTGYVDLVDVELFAGDKFVKEMIDGAHEAGVKVVASNHDFFKTPDKDEIISRFCKMQELGADILKIAVMPRTRRDVLTLLAATEEMYTEHADRPIITMSMAGDGVISRVAGEAFGSSMTFGAAGKASAPGQMDVHDLNTVLKIMHKSM